MTDIDRVECITEDCREPNKGVWSGGYCTECMKEMIGR